MASIVIPQWLGKVFNPAVGGEYPDDRVALQQAMVRENVVPAATKKKMRYHGVDLLATDREGNTFFVRGGKNIKVALPPNDVSERYSGRGYIVDNQMGNLVDKVPQQKKKVDHVDRLGFGFPM